MAGVLYTVATPIGNLEDMSPRAVKTLENADYILCEDTRVSSKLLGAFNISKKLVAYHKFNEKEQLKRVISDIQSGQNVALISDAGTPCISDPGRILVNELYKIGIRTIPISGACAVSTFLSAVAKDTESYIFTGFIPRTKKEQKEFFEKYACADLIFYDSPNRIIKTLENIIEFLGADTKIAIGRELTKLYEEIKIDTAQNLLQHFSTNQPRGEFVVMLYKNVNETTGAEEENSPQLQKNIETLLQKGFSTKDVSVILSSIFEVNKNTVYKLASNAKIK